MRLGIINSLSRADYETKGLSLLIWGFVLENFLFLFLYFFLLVFCFHILFLETSYLSQEVIIL